MKIKSHRKYTFEIIDYEDGTSTINRTNDGFSVVELLGILEIVRSNLLNVFKDAVKKPDEENINSTNSPIIHE